MKSRALDNEVLERTNSLQVTDLMLCIEWSLFILKNLTEPLNKICRQHSLCGTYNYHCTFKA